MAPKFSVVLVDYEGAASRDEFRRAMQCFADQTCKDFEILVYHDGAKATSYEEDLAGVDGLPAVRFFISSERENDWGHSNRDRGIKAAVGEWIVMTNADNVFYPNAIEELKAAVERPYRPMFEVRTGNAFQKLLYKKRLLKFVEKERADILVFPIISKGCAGVSNGIRRFRGTENVHEVVLSGIPVREGNIDAMQFVMRRECWLSEGGWRDKHERSDGRQYEKFARKYGIQAITKVLGEHW